MTPGRQIGIVGGGLLGLATGRALSQAGHRVVVFEKEDAVAAHQSGHNSGVVHSGIYYTPGSLKATLCRRGVGLLEQFCRDNDVPYQKVGKVVVALNDCELGRLHDIEQRARRNHVPQVRWLDAAQLRAIEPEVSGVAALHSPTTAIVDYPAMARALAESIRRHGGQVRVNSTVTSLTTTDNCARVRVGDEETVFDHVLTCAGLHADAVGRAAGGAHWPSIVPFRGEYYRLVPQRRGLVRGLVYPVPDPAYPFLGVHFTPRTDGNVDVGPNAVLALSREGYRRRDVSVRDVIAMLGDVGARRLFRAHWRTGLTEMRGSLFARTFVARARRYVPALSVHDVVAAPAGVRAQAVGPTGELVDDFRFDRIGAVTAVRNAPSPAATSSLAIGEHIARLIES